jgi:putative peptide maturation system protein
MSTALMNSGHRVSADSDVVAETFDVLRVAVDDGTGEAGLREQLAAVHRRHGEFRFDLVVDQEAYDGRPTFDVLIRDRAGRTVSLSISDPAGLPWPLRGVARASEFDLLQVNGVKMSVQEAMSSIDGIFDDRHVLRSLIDACLLGAAIDDAGLAVSAAQLEDASDSFRRARGLQTASATNDWLKERSLSVEQFAIMIEQQAKIAKLREQLFGSRADEQLGARGAATGQDSGTLQVAWVAPALGDNTAEGELAADPLAAIVAARRDRRPAGIEQWRPRDVPDRFNQILTADVGEVVVLPGDSSILAVVLDREPAADLAREREVLLRDCFDEWLAERRKAARVQWFWGNQRRTASAVHERRP